MGILGLYEVVEAFGYTKTDDFGYISYTDEGVAFASKIFEVLNEVKDIRLTELLPEVQKKVDSKEIAFSPAVELSYLTRDEQKQFLDAMDYSQNTPSLSQAQRLKKLSREGKCTKEAMRSIMSEEKKEEQERITLSSDTLRKYFPRSYTPLQMQQTIIKLLEQWQKKQQRRNER